MSKKGLGKGVGALFSDPIDLSSFDAARSGERVQQLPVKALRPNPAQPRKHFDAARLAELAESIREYGVMQPLIVVAEEDHYLLVAGERRFRAAQQAGLETLPCIVRQLSHSQLAELSLLENIQREDLSPLEEAAAYQQLMDEYGYTQEQLAQRLGKSRPHVANTLRLLKLSPQDRVLLAEGRISAGHARALLALDDPRARAAVTSLILRDGLSVRQTEALVQRQLKKQPAAVSSPTSDALRRRLIHDEIARRFSDRLGVKVRIEGQEERGRVVLEFGSEDDLQNISDAILGKGSR